MTIPTVPDPQEHAAAILTALATWLGAKSGRSFTLSHTEEGWRAGLEVQGEGFVEAEVLAGCSALDALAQIAQTAALE